MSMKLTRVGSFSTFLDADDKFIGDKLEKRTTEESETIRSSLRDKT